MQDQLTYLRSRGIEAAMLGSSVPETLKRTIYEDLDRPYEDESDGLPLDETKDFDPVPCSKRKRRICLLFMSPELLCSERGRSILSTLIHQGRIPFLAIDEVHTLSEWGHSFRSSFLKLSYLKETFPELPLMLLTATATRHVQMDVLHQLHIEKDQIDIIRQSFNRPNIRYAIQMKETLKVMEGEEMTIYQHMKNFIDASQGLVPHATTPMKSTPAVATSAAVAAAQRLFGTSASSSTPATATPASQPIGCSGIIYCGTKDACDQVASELRKLKGTGHPHHCTTHKE